MRMTFLVLGAVFAWLVTLPQSGHADPVDDLIRSNYSNLQWFNETSRFWTEQMLRDVAAQPRSQPAPPPRVPNPPPPAGTPHVRWLHLQASGDGRWYPAPGYTWTHVDRNGHPPPPDWRVRWTPGIPYQSLGIKVSHRIAGPTEGRWVTKDGQMKPRDANRQRRR